MTLNGSQIRRLRVGHETLACGILPTATRTPARQPGYVDLYTIPQPDRLNAPARWGRRPSSRRCSRRRWCAEHKKMKEQLKQFVADKRGVSPVIGVVLMVAVVVILAAVIGAFVLGLGGNQQSTPQASFSVDSSGALVMEGGDTLQGENIAVTLDGTDQGATGGEITAGTEVATLGADATGTVRVIYTANGQSSTIWQTTLGSGGDGGGGGGGA